MNSGNFSSKNRSVIIEKMNASIFDILIIGGGITGAGIALDASARGLKVALIDMQDFAAGTSSRSTKLIHGGLRYLKQFEFKLVAEVGKEREIIHRNAPHLTKPEPMLLPIVKGGSLGKFSTRIAMWIYEWLAGVKKEEWHKILSKEETIKAEPLLEKNNLLGGVLFYEYRTDDARLTIEVIKEAVNRGATALNYMKAISFNYEKEKICGAIVQDQITKKEYSIKAKYVVNASGPWVDELDDLETKKETHKLQLTKGVHIVVDQKKLPVKQSLYFDTHDKRMIFIIPREGKTYIGTTDTFYNGDLVDPKVTQEDTVYLLKCCNAYFPNNQILETDIESSWAGLRPLIKKPGKGPSEISRKDEMFESASGMIIIAGGKLTGYRKMAERVVDLIGKKTLSTENKTLSECSTSNISIAGGKLNSNQSFSTLKKTLIEQGNVLGLSNNEAETLVYRYGPNTLKIFKFIEQLKNEESDLPVLIRAQIQYCIEYEMCLTPEDFFIRRTGMSYFAIGEKRKWEEELVKYMKKIIDMNGAGEVI
ncbi:MAG: FAD-dependent oxidoreductase [Bacteroidota bacterium]|nr:FAD-dependent oxidoreductase [Bacteroidota bacterium]